MFERDILTEAWRKLGQSKEFCYDQMPHSPIKITITIKTEIEVKKEMKFKLGR